MTDLIALRCRPWLVVLWGLLLVLSGAASAQVRVTGSVSDKATKQPIPGATIWNINTRRGTVANAEGDFAVTVGARDTLEFRAVGYGSYRLPLGNTGLSQIIVQVKLERATIQLGEVRVREGRPDEATINRALRNIKRPTAPPNAVKRPPKPQPLFPVDSTAPKAPVPTLASPISLLYDMFSREGEQRRKLEEIETNKRIEAELAKRRAYNQFFRVNQGYEVEGDLTLPITVPQQLPKQKLPQQPVQPPAGSLAPKQ
ncbi:carboxypeptidase-like regulatory domain-containing protein [Hymenobacter busanensis]|uniref:carboxypeptidase-like regulatory domain-containing protein n=1 Tax=Hymenobacter busanensis TaxID=2607656 RepID=UPI00141E8A56|nr:carboxypeptidase-like regulatory domain-containing protein [Hymenobacter busanensis]